MRGHRLGRFLRFIAGGMALVGVTPAYAAPAAPASAQQLCMGERSTVVGTPGDDRLEGTPGRDVIVALDGDDTVQAQDEDDLICAGDGHDRVFAGLGDDRVRGGEGRDRIRGGDGNDDVDGGWEEDRLHGGEGDDRLSGGRYDPLLDHAVYATSASPISADLATGRVTGAATGTDELWYMEGVVGTPGADELFGDAMRNDLAGRGGDDTIDGRGGDDALYGGERGAWWQSGDDGRDVLHGRDGNDRISGGYGSDELFGDGGADVLMSLGLWGPNPALEGAGTLHGGKGDDELVSGRGNDTLDGEDGFDLVSYAHAGAGVAVDLRGQRAVGEGADALVSIEGAIGTGFVDSLLGDDGPNLLDGNWGGDTVRGFGEDDRLSGRNGFDALPLTLDGGEGDDELTLHGSGPYAVSGGGTLAGGPGDDVLRSRPLGYTLDGGEGSDAAAYPSRYTGTVIDLVRGRAWFNDEQCPGGEGCFEDILVSIENAEGGNADDVLLGNDAPNVLAGLGRQDRIEGGGGDDTIDGGPGVDSADGGEGADTCANVEAAVSC